VSSNIGSGRIESDSYADVGKYEPSVSLRFIKAVSHRICFQPSLCRLAIIISTSNLLGIRTGLNMPTRLLSSRE
jgi:hypothetical protein